MHIACTISAVLTLFVSLVPGVQDVFKLNRVDAYCYGMAIALAFLCMFIDEVYKINYRQILFFRKKAEIEEQRSRFTSERVQVIAEMLEKHTLWMDNAKHDMRELKLHVAEVESQLR